MRHRFVRLTSMAALALIVGAFVGALGPQKALAGLGPFNLPNCGNSGFQPVAIFNPGAGSSGWECDFIPPALLAGGTATYTITSPAGGVTFAASPLILVTGFPSWGSCTLTSGGGTATIVVTCAAGLAGGVPAPAPAPPGSPNDVGLAMVPVAGGAAGPLAFTATYTGLAPAPNTGNVTYGPGGTALSYQLDVTPPVVVSPFPAAGDPGIPGVSVTNCVNNTNPGSTIFTQGNSVTCTLTFPTTTPVSPEFVQFIPISGFAAFNLNNPAARMGVPGLYCGTTSGTAPFGTACTTLNFSFTLTSPGALNFQIQISALGAAATTRPCAAVPAAGLPTCATPAGGAATNLTAFSFTAGSPGNGPIQSGIGCANSTLPTDIAFATTGVGTLTAGNQIISSPVAAVPPPLSSGSVTPPALNVNVPNGVVECGAVFLDVPAFTPFFGLDADPSTIAGGTITYNLATPVVSTIQTGQPIAVILESNSSSTSISCGTTQAPSGGANNGLESCQGAVLLNGSAAATVAPTCFTTPAPPTGCAFATPTAGNLIHVALRTGASFPLIGGSSPVVIVNALYQRFSSLGTVPGVTPPVSIIFTGSTVIGIGVPIYGMALTANPPTVPSGSGIGFGSTMVALLFHGNTTVCPGIAGFVVTGVTQAGGFVVCPTAAQIAAGAPAAITANAPGAESGVVNFFTTSGVFGNTSSTPGANGQQAVSVRCGALPNTPPIILVPVLSQPYTFSMTQCVSAQATLYGGGNAGTAVVTAEFIGDFSGSVAEATTTVQLSPSSAVNRLSQGCNEVITGAQTAAGSTVASVVGQVQPGGIVVSAWQFSNTLHAFQAGFFSTQGAPIDFTTIGPSQSLFICISGNGGFPTGAF